MRSLLSDVCWPSRYYLRWLLVFLVFMILGILIRPKQDVQAQVRLRVYYTDVLQGELTGAIVYLDAKTLAEANRKRSFDFPPEGTTKILAPGRRDCVIQPITRNTKAPLGPPEHQILSWPRKENTIVELEIRRNYPKPAKP